MSVCEKFIFIWISQYFRCMRKGALLALTLFFSLLHLNAQNVKVTGKIVEKDKQRPLSGVYVVAINIKDTTLTYIAVTDEAGNFLFSGLKIQEQYKLMAKYVGFDRLTKTIIVTPQTENIGTFIMNENVQTIQEVVINGQAPPVIQKGDTTEMNASAFKVNPDANAQDLVKKMPGVTIENGTVKAHGEAIKRVMVDGKNYFGEDPSLALQNLPAEVVDKVQIFNKMSDQAAFTGFDEGQSSKVMNIITRLDKRNGINGRLSAGSDFQDKYAVNGKLNYSNSASRIAITAGSNNVNQQNFGTQDMLGSMGGNNQGMFMGLRQGINTTQSFGVNYGGDIAKKISITCSYFFNAQKNRTNTLSNISYFSAIDTINQSNLHSNQINHSTNGNNNHRFDMKLEFALDSANSLTWSSRFSTQQNNGSSQLSQLNYYLPEEPVLNSNTINGSNGLGYNHTSDLLFKHKFTKKGRTISLGVSILGNLQKYDGTQWGLTAEKNKGLQELDQIQTDTSLINQKSNSNIKSTTIYSNLVYTEPVGKNGLIQLSYKFSMNTGSDNKYSYNQAITPIVLDTNLSNVYKTHYNTQRGGISYQVRGREKKLTAVFGIDYQRADLSGSSSFSIISGIDRIFYNVIPNAMLSYNFFNKANLRFAYFTYTNPPPVSQLQDVVTVYNSLSFSQGNPGLKNEYTHSGSINFNFSNPQKFNNLGINLSGGCTKNSIGNEVFIMDKDSALIPGDTLKRTGQLSKPVNLNNSWNVRAFVTYGLLFKPMKCNINLFAGGGYTMTPGYINKVSNFTNQYNLTGGMSIGSNISQSVDFNVSYTTNYTIANIVYRDQILNSELAQNPNSNRNSWNHSINLQSNFIWHGFVLQNSLVEQINRGLSGGYNQDYLQWNISLGKKMFKDNSTELKLSVFDVLNQNNNITHSISAFSISDSKTNTLHRYFLLSFSYNFRNYKSSPDIHSFGHL